MRLILTILFSNAIFAFALSSGQANVSMSTAPFYILDSNTPCASGPRAAYIGIKVTNLSSTDTLYNVNVKLDSIVGNSGFKFLGGTDSVTVIGQILPSSSRVAYFYMQYSCTHSLTANYFFKISNNQSGVLQFNSQVYTRSSISAGTGGQLVSQTLGFYDVLGSIIVDTVTYEYGNIGKDDEFILQPNGDTLFTAGQVRLLNMKVLSSDIPNVIPVGTVDKFWFIAPTSPGGAGSGNQVKVVYFYVNLLYNDSITFYPYAGATSGSTNFKYSSNYANTTTGFVGFRTTTASNQFSTTIRGSCDICTPADTIMYTVTVTNTSATCIQIDRIINLLPSGYTYLSLAPGSDITSVNSSLLPDSGDAGKLIFEGLVPTTFPYESYVICNADSLVLKFYALVSSSSSNVIFSDTAYVQLGTILTDTVTHVSCAGCSALPVTLISFSAKKYGKHTLLEWETASEINNKEFNLYWSIDGVNFYFFDQIAGAGNSNSRRKYSLLDMANRNGNFHHYRLEQVDYDGQSSNFYTYLKTENTVTAVLRPNPFSSSVELVIPAGRIIVSIEVSDIYGKNILYLNQDEVTNSKVTIDTRSWETGVYSIRIRDLNRSEMVTTIIKSNN